MNLVIRALSVYIFLLILMRFAGKRSLAQITTFDFILLLILSETTQQALLGNDFSLSNAFLLMLTLVMAEIGLSLIKSRFPVLEKWLDGTPLIIVQDGKVLEDRTNWTRIGLEDILAAARESHGLERLDQIKYAVLEASGGISIIPKPSAK
ncbi:MAG TPA: YetF domain-containing protein [Anaerolineales bacterium]|nr:YetF domain-containing protein [Anaerolineales bacterium]